MLIVLVAAVAFSAALVVAHLATTPSPRPSQDQRQLRAEAPLDRTELELFIGSASADDLGRAA